MSTPLSADEARRVVLGAQGFSVARPSGGATLRHATSLLGRVGAVQLDSVNVIARAHELTLFSRLGDHPRNLAERLVSTGRAFEYWGHEASLLPVELHRLLRWRMEAARNGEIWSGLSDVFEEQPDYVERVLKEITIRGPLSARDLPDRGAKAGPWWGWDAGKRALEYLFWTGTVTAWRRPNFERVYDLTERALPSEILNAPTPTQEDAQKQLLLRAAAAFGVATAADLADAFRIKAPVARPLIAELVEEGALGVIAVEGWRHPAYRTPGTRTPCAVDARALLAPFDSLMWGRDRVERLFGFHYRLEIYVPAPKRVYGYYVMPFLLGEDLVARVEMKSDRKAGVLNISGAWAEPGVELGLVAEALASEASSLAEFLGLDRVTLGRRGDLMKSLRSAVSSLDS
ncbi:MAG: crosslink repair DNA glycosylase YcaQ family protein [Actinomycetes bacterium]